MTQYSSQPDSIPASNEPWCIFNSITSPQHLYYELRSPWAIPSLSVAGPNVQTALIIRTIGQSTAISDTAAKDNEGRSASVFIFQALCQWLFKQQTLLSQHISPDQLERAFFFCCFCFFRLQGFSVVALKCSKHSWWVCLPLYYHLLCQLG